MAGAVGAAQRHSPAPVFDAESNQLRGAAAAKAKTAYSTHTLDLKSLALTDFGDEDQVN